ncbi:glutamine amidotransferase [Pseudoduganella ginsengisoli]|uniref:Glutamine amidotransferase n=1 Tax=Pseudoduganella ginsengisoli TaxID=1462440 RepID=A0A6L6Q1X7_9BURK|nr:glutamine amidotransferase [Pseudoduganella ginsengisoli]MTW03630.1 glutamine amidotransferase [Pseudoduganella ginsengisoli]
MKNVVAIQHVAFEHLGSLEAVLVEQGYTVHYLPAWASGLAAQVKALEPKLLVVLGGPIGVYEEDRYPFLHEEKALLEERLAAGKATLGICLGAQLMAAALGGEVYASGVKEIGWSPLTLTSAGQDSPLRFLSGELADVLHWHGDTFTLPPGAVHLASTPMCANQAFSYGPRALGLQFHLEAEGEQIEHWLVGHACEIAGAGVDVAALRRGAQRHGAALQQQARQFFSAWLAQAVQRD